MEYAEISEFKFHGEYRLTLGLSHVSHLAHLEAAATQSATNPREEEGEYFDRRRASTYLMSRPAPAQNGCRLGVVIRSRSQMN